ncbi:MAG: ABC transporter permease subunit [Gammaproteobacteria bacterium]|nr:ABC transporter permease subunit [Gammaproteobacteria bacterium]
MIASIARKEFSEIVRDGRFKWTAGIMALLLLTALAAGYQKYSAYMDIQRMSQDQTNAQWLNQGDKNPHAGAHYGNYAFKPAGPLAFFDNGINNYAGTALFMEAHKQNFAIGRPATDQSSIGRFGDLSGAMILQLLMPLLIIFLGFTAFSGERESGTLRQVLSMGVSNRQLLWGKALGIGGVVLLIVGLCVLAGGLALSLTGPSTESESLGARATLMALSYVLYGGIFLFLTLAVSAWAKNARTALMVLIGFWAFAGFLAPKAAVEISKAIHPTPAFGKWMADMRSHQMRGFDGVPPFVRFEQESREIFAEYGAESIAELPVYVGALRLQKFEEYDFPVFEQHYGQLRDSYTNQRRLQDRIGIVAPTLPLRSLSMALAGTDLIRHVNFADAAEAYRRDMVLKVNNYLGEAAASLNTGYGGGNVLIADEAIFAMVPPFRFDSRGLQATLAEHAGNFIALMLWLAAALGLALWSVQRLKVEED